MGSSTIALPAHRSQITRKDMELLAGVTDGQYSSNPKVKKNQQRMLEQFDINQQKIQDLRSDWNNRANQRNTVNVNSESQIAEIPASVPVSSARQTRAVTEPIATSSQSCESTIATIPMDFGYIPQTYPVSFQSPMVPLSTIPSDARILSNGQIGFNQGSLCKLDPEVLEVMECKGYQLPAIKPDAEDEKFIYVTPQKYNSIIKNCPAFNQGYILNELHRETPRQKYERERTVV